jgi:hypothetical protein
MKTKTLMITIAILAILAGTAVTNLAGQQQGTQKPVSPSTQLTEGDVAYILLMREEEKLARDVYFYMYELWGAEIFANIGESEQRHMDAVGRLITRYGLEDPVAEDTEGVFTDEAITALYAQLIEQGSVSLEAALQVGVDIEELDITDLEDALKEVSMRSIQRVFNNLLGGSENHLAAFQNAIETGITDCPLQDGTGLGAGQGGTCRQDCDGSMTRQGGQGAGSNGNGDGVCLQ